MLDDGVGEVGDLGGDSSGREAQGGEGPLELTKLLWLVGGVAVATFLLLGDMGGDFVSPVEVATGGGGGESLFLVPPPSPILLLMNLLMILSIMLEPPLLILLVSVVLGLLERSRAVLFSSSWSVFAEASFSFGRSRLFLSSLGVSGGLDSLTATVVPSCLISALPDLRCADLSFSVVL